ncbi:hypothetical protein QBC38DRAFT_464524 [Podospora fimiseda]|uniref:Secreted peptide n=1 Tax=Podospora fimiseda TaxID=252190 RepID=A0AAN7BZN3_9PEZI|nr:hypothetical protein QBC38DRAFT_464524 [Podospora fimiseda]
MYGLLLLLFPLLIFGKAGLSKFHRRVKGVVVPVVPAVVGTTAGSEDACSWRGFWFLFFFSGVDMVFARVWL